MDYYIITVQYTSHILVVWLLGVQIYVYKHKNLLDGFKYSDTILLTANHLSELDPMYIGIMYDYYFKSKSHITSFVKQTLRFYPLINSLLLSSDTIFVENKNTQQNRLQHIYITNKLQTDEYKNRTVLIFPEGTTYSQKVKEYRESNAIKNNTPVYNNLLIPKTNGLHLIRKNANIGDEFNIVMKFISRKDNDDHNLAGILHGQTPKEVHLMLIKNDEKFDDKIMEIENRHLFDNYVFDSFSKMDKVLDKNITTWSIGDYVKTLVKPSWESIFWSLFYILILLIVIPLMFTNRYVASYTILSIIFFYIMAFLEFRKNSNKRIDEIKEKID